MYEQTTVRTLYKKLLTFYPQEFKEQFGESMEQTFNDLSKERQTGGGWFGFMLWTFGETAAGILREHLLLITEGDFMQTILTNLKLPVLISSMLVIPFMIMEVVNRRNFNEGFPIPLFIFMWVLPILFVVTLMPIVRNVRAGNNLMASPVNLLIRVVILVFIAWMWTSLLIDQMPCFLGVPNCD
jgi:hypothetical protein